MNRRDLLLAATSALASGPVEARAAGSPFVYGVASGDPSAASVVLWTALAPGAEGGDLTWRLRRAEDGAVVKQGQVAVGPASGWTAKVRVDGLEPDRAYAYDFARGGVTSPAGRTRTLPAHGTRPMRFAVFSCARYSSGWFHAYRHAAQDRSLDFAVHLGDYIYEGADAPGGHPERRHAPAHELRTLADYRTRHGQHKADADLQALHAALPMLAIWDDHEFADDASRGGEHTSRPSEWAERSAAARRAYFEWMPILPNDADGIWRKSALGDLADLYALDTRLDGRSAPLDPADPRFGSADRQLLGAAQEHWLATSLAGPAKPWTLFLSSVILSPLAWPADLMDHVAESGPAWGRGLLQDRVNRSNLGQAGNPDAWDGWPAAQARFMTALSGRRNLVLSGDTHSSWSFGLRDAGGAPLGWEIGAPSVTTEASLDTVSGDQQEVEALFKRRNPALDYLDPASRGYVVVDLAPDAATVEWRHVSSVASRTADWRVGKRQTLA